MENISITGNSQEKLIIFHVFTYKNIHIYRIRGPWRDQRRHYDVTMTSQPNSDVIIEFLGVSLLRYILSYPVKNER